MSRAPLPLLLALLGSQAACALPILLPPTRTVITGGARPADGAGGTTHLLSGVHLASASASTRLPVDVGAGLVVETSADEGIVDQGGYAELGALLGAGGVRASVGGRAEWLVSETLRGAQGRRYLATVGVELFHPSELASGGFSSSCVVGGGLYRGTWGLGAVLDAGYQQLPGGAGGFVATAGLSLRLPAIIGFVIASPSPC